MARRSRNQPGLHDQAWHYLLGLGPDLAFLQESLPPAWIRGEGTLAHGPFKQWGSVIFSPRFPLERFRLPQETNLRALGSYLAFGEASLPDGSEIFVASVHAPARPATTAQMEHLDSASASRPSARRPRINDVVFIGLDKLVVDRQFIVAGDWNTARIQGSALGKKLGAEFFERARDRGWSECVPKNGKEVRTWFGAGDHLRQDDHAFCDSALADRLQNVRTAEDAATDLGLSDHAPLILDFEVAPVSMTSLVERPQAEDES
jgi:hypothetical protein